MNDPNSQAMMMTCTRRSGVMSVKPCRMVFRAPPSCSVFSSRMAPKMMYRTVSATTRPLIDAATTCTAGTCHTTSASTMATPYDSGIARLAGQRSPTRKTATVMIGNNDRMDSVAMFMAGAILPQRPART